MKAFSSLALAFVMAVLSLGGRWADPQSISAVHVSHHALGRTLAEYKVDLTRMSVWEWKLDDQGSWQRDADARFEGYAFAGWLRPSRIRAFRNAAEQAGFTGWEDRYDINDGLDDGMIFYDGHQWSVTITFGDGTQKTTYGSNAYPATWGDMAQALTALTGKHIL